MPSLAVQAREPAAELGSEHRGQRRSAPPRRSSPRAPRRRAVDATSWPMKPAPTTTRRDPGPSAARSAARVGEACGARARFEAGRAGQARAARCRWRSAAGRSGRADRTQDDARAPRRRGARRVAEEHVDRVVGVPGVGAEAQRALVRARRPGTPSTAAAGRTDARALRRSCAASRRSRRGAASRRRAGRPGRRRRSRCPWRSCPQRRRRR